MRTLRESASTVDPGRFKQGHSMNNAAATMLGAVLERIDDFMGDEDEPVNGGDAVDFLAELQEDIRSFLKKSN